MPVNPANYGSNSVGAVQKQSDFDTPLTAFTTAAKLIEPTPPTTLQPVREHYPADRLKGNPSPDPMVAGMQLGAGLLTFFLDPITTPFWLIELFMAATSNISSQDLDSTSSSRTTPFTTALRAAAAYTSGTALTALTSANQPAARIEAHKDRATDPDGTFQGGTVRAIPYPSGFRSAKIQLQFQSGTSTGNRKVEIVGTDLNDREISEEINRTDITMAVTNGDSAYEITSTKYYKTVTSIKVTDSGSTPVSGTLAVIGLLDAYYHRITLNQDVNEGLTIEMHEGNRDTPTTYRGAHVSRGIINLAPVSQFAAMIFASKCEPRKSISGGANGSDFSSLARVKPNFVPDWGYSFEIVDDGTVPSELVGQHRIANIQFLIDNLIAPPKTRYAESIDYPKCTRQGNRNLMFTTAVDHHKDLNFDQYIGGDAAFQSYVSAVTRPIDGSYLGLRFAAVNSQIVEFPSRPVIDLSELVQNLSVRMNVGTSSTGNDEAYLEVYNTKSTP